LPHTSRGPGNDVTPRLLIGRDTRESGTWIEAELAYGASGERATVTSAGVVPTPAVAYLTRSVGYDAGIVISASHNPFEDNGIKVFSGRGEKFTETVEREVEAIVSDESWSATGGQAGSVRQGQPVDAYLEHLRTVFPEAAALEGFKLVVDCANGAAYRVIPDALWELGAEVIPIGVDPDGFNINKDCGSTEPDALRRKVLELRADIGIALDGDADRVVITDERGHLVDGDQLLAVIAESWHKDGRLAKPGIVTTIMSNFGLERHLDGLGIKVHRVQVGDRYVLEEMRQHGINLGGEPSGHIILSDYTTTGDGFVAALQVLAVVKKVGQPVSAVCHRFDALPQITKNVRYQDGKPHEDARVRSAIASGDERLNGHGRLIVRPSGTEPVVRVTGEGEDLSLVEEVVDGIVDALNQAAAGNQTFRQPS